MLQKAENLRSKCSNKPAADRGEWSVQAYNISTINIQCNYYIIIPARILPTIILMEWTTKISNRFKVHFIDENVYIFSLIRIENTHYSLKLDEESS